LGKRNHLKAGGRKIKLEKERKRRSADSRALDKGRTHAYHRLSNKRKRGKRGSGKKTRSGPAKRKKTRTMTLRSLRRKKWLGKKKNERPKRRVYNVKNAKKSRKKTRKASRSCKKSKKIRGTGTGKKHSGEEAGSLRGGGEGTFQGGPRGTPTSLGP